jgi:hypothetical protein
LKQIVVFLQNSWSPQWAGRPWPRSQWLKALWRSRSGTRLISLTVPLEFTQEYEFWFDNASPIVGEHAGSTYKADTLHMAGVLAVRTPHVVVCMGRVAADGWRLLPEWRKICPCLITPHPTYRVVTNDLFNQAAQQIIAGFSGTLELKQERGEVCLSKWL